MSKFTPQTAFPRFTGLLVAASLALVIPAAPAHAGGDITNFTVRNCTSERMFVCSYDKTDGSLKIPYKARGVQPNDKKEFGCASLNKCKVIIGVSKRKSKKTLSTGMEAALTTASAGSAGVVVAGSAGLYVLGDIAASVAAVNALTVAGVVGGVAGVVIAVGAAASVAGIEIADGWSDGEVCNQVRRAAQKAGMKPKSFMKNGKAYKVVEQYATDENSKLYLNPDGTAVFAYVVNKDESKCPTQLKAQIIP